MEIRHLVIHGKVQGVGYRHTMTREASRLKVRGWVRNRREGTVEAMICGDADAIAVLMAWVRQGPAGATVDLVEVELGRGDFNGFEQWPTQ